MILSEDAGDLQGSCGQKGHGLNHLVINALEQGLQKVPFLGMFEDHHLGQK